MMSEALAYFDEVLARFYDAPDRVFVPSWTGCGAFLFLRSDSESFHLAIEMAALEAEHFGGAGHVAVILVEGFEDVVALVSVTGLMQRGEFALGGAAAAFTVNQRRQVFAVEARGRGIHDHDAFNNVAQLAHVSGPGVTH